VPDLRSVSFLWPLVLYSALLVPVLGIAYAYFTKRFPPIVLSLGLCLLCIAMARPQALLLTTSRSHSHAGFGHFWQHARQGFKTLAH